MKKGFSLVELLVSISILAILTLISLMAFSSVQKNSRDAKRKADLSIIQSALEQYHADQGYYPTVLPDADDPLTFGSKTYLNRIPKDPKDAEPYKYLYIAIPSSPACDNTAGKLCSRYCLYGEVENESNRIDLSSCPDQSTPGQEKHYEVAPN